MTFFAVETCGYFLHTMMITLVLVGKEHAFKVDVDVIFLHFPEDKNGGFSTWYSK